MNADKTLRKLYDLTDREFGDIQSRMWKNGYRNTYKTMELVYHYLGPTITLEVCNAAFHNSELEAKFLRLEEPIAFAAMCKINQAEAFRGVCESLPHLIGQNISFNPCSDAEILARIRHKYHCHKGKNL